MQEPASACPAPPQVAATASLELQYIFIHIFLEGVMETSETLYDTHTALFERILLLAERLILIGQSEGYFRLSLDSGIIVPLFLVAMKCRDVGLRGRAIMLLRNAPEQEGMWHRDNVLAVALWKLREEEGSESSEGVLHSPIPEGDRVHSERATTATVHGKQVTLLRFKKGLTDLLTGDKWNEQVVSLPLFMGEML
ncbi:hypothetical protein LTR36_007394 [Oleoguttula mirabilis]|uniref:Uncharacterized protein n=1 Tax=Oleoguttula mirabilis TaxID=1507867 RepID=A0AAV9J9T4_9PEZI|nr:hypothetical protein LTR36_007394 [Oleoguttula mirabilis]